jgi:CTP:molybdopterin cytidylyltransferase MocA
MQLIVPMAGFGERFRAAGYELPKPLIPVRGRPMVAHVVDLFPGVDRVVLMVNEEHLAEPRYELLAQLREHLPAAEIVPVASHRRGPVHTLHLGRAAIAPEDDVALAMCDLFFGWDFEAFRAAMHEADGPDGAVVVYRGFHPHLLRSTHYGFVQEQRGRIVHIQEKQAYTRDPIGNREPCSNGVYWLRSGRMLMDYVDALEHREDLRIGGELYISQVFDPMLRDGRRVVAWDTDQYCQWGNPEDFSDWSWHERGFALRGARPRPSMAPPMPGALLVPMAGLGQRFADQGYPDPKPLLPVEGGPMVVAAARDLPRMTRTVFVQRADLPGLDRIQAALEGAFPGCAQIVLDGPTDGQARTVAAGLELGGVDPALPVVVGTCDNGVEIDPARHAALLGAHDVLVWGMVGHPGAARHPRMYGWIDGADGGQVRGVSVKVPLHDPARDPAVTGVFSFRRAADLDRCCQRLFARDGRVRGEWYLDSAIDDALALGLDTRVFEVDHYHGWGTPEDWQIWSYWARFFRGWSNHPYAGRAPG